jgi:hypothetical protein
VLDHIRIYLQNLLLMYKYSVQSAASTIELVNIRGPALLRDVRRQGPAASDGQSRQITV